MSKSIVLVLEPNHESEYGEYANTPAFNAHGDIIGWTGGEVSESGHSCEFNVLNDEGFITCASSTTVNKLRGENAKLREQLDVAEHNQTRNAREYARLCHENDKLRELVQKMMRFMEDGDWCTTCEVAKECDAQECDTQEQYEEDCLMRGVFHDRMRELGIEVDDGGDLV